MPRRWAWLIGGIVMGFGFLFFTIWSDSVPDARTMAAILFACASAVILSGEVRGSRRKACPHQAAATKPRD